MRREPAKVPREDGSSGPRRTDVAAVVAFSNGFRHDASRMRGFVPDGPIGVDAMDRRKFLKRAGWAALGSVAAGGIYPLLEAKWCRVVRRTIAMPNLPSPFRGTT